MAAGVLLAALYVAVLAATAAVSGRPVRPLFDGFAPPEAYRWVKPPPELAAGNEQPAPASRDIRLDPISGSAVSNTTTPDSQAIASIEFGSVPPSPPDTHVRLELEPLDPATLGPLPGGLRVVSNAYRVGITLVPSGTPVGTLAPPGTVALTASSDSDTLLYSVDGLSWAPVETRPYGVSHGQFGELVSPGFFLVASSAPAPAPGPGGGGASSTLVVVLLGLIPVAAGAFLLWGRARPARAKATATARAKAKATGKRRSRRSSRAKARHKGTRRR